MTSQEILEIIDNNHGQYRTILGKDWAHFADEESCIRTFDAIKPHCKSIQLHPARNLDGFMQQAGFEFQI